MENTTLYEYLLVIPPSDVISLDAKRLKAECKEKYGWNEPTKSKPHITLVNLIQPRSTEEKLVNKLRKIAASTSPFDVLLSGFGKFTGPRNTIYLNIQNAQQITELVKSIKKATKPFLRRIKNLSPVYSLTPHLTIAKGISECNFKEAWPSWQTKTYEACSYTSELLLLRRILSTSINKYEPVASFPLQGCEPLDKQLTLF